MRERTADGIRIGRLRCRRRRGRVIGGHHHDRRGEAGDQPAPEQTNIPLTWPTPALHGVAVGGRGRPTLFVADIYRLPGRINLTSDGVSLRASHPRYERAASRRRPRYCTELHARALDYRALAVEPSYGPVLRSLPGTAVFGVGASTVGENWLPPVGFRFFSVGEGAGA